MRNYKRFRIKIGIIILLTCSFFNNVMGQVDGSISLSMKNVSLDVVLKQIQDKTMLNFLYNYDEVSKIKGLNVEFQNQKISDVLSTLLNANGFTFSISNNTVVINKGKSSQRVARKTVTGLVTGEKKEPLIGVHVHLKGVNSGVTTDAYGTYTISYLSTNADPVLVFSYIGYERKEITVNGSSIIDVTLKESDSQIDELVISTGYQTVNKRELASAIFKIDQESINLVSKTSVDQMITGQIPGLVAVASSGEPGATPTIRIRGTSSIVGTRSPLWVLDGIILEDPVNIDLSNLNSPDAAYLVGNAIAGINPSDIESITVLKDASATAIYGSRAANGVIVVSTKSGKVGKTRVTYSGNVTFNQRVGYGNLNQMNAGERIQLSQEIISDNIRYLRIPTNLGYEGLLMDYNNNKLSYNDFTAAITKMANNNTDWYQLLFRNSISQKHSASLSGGNDKTTYYASLGYDKTEGTARGSSQDRYSAMAKINSWINNRLYVGFQLNASNSITKGFHDSVNPNRYAYETSRTIPAYNEDGSYYMYNLSRAGTTSGPKEDLWYNILNEMKYTGQNSNVSNITAQLNLQYKILPTVRYKLLGGFDQSKITKETWAKEESNYVSMIRRWNPGSLVQGTQDYESCVIPYGGIISMNNQKKDSYTFRNSLEFSEIFNGVHLVTALGAMEMRSVKYTGLYGTYYGWQPDRGQTVAPAMTAAYKALSLNPVLMDNVNNNLSWIGTAAYTYKDKLTISGNVRADGSNNFGNNPKFRFLPIWSVAGKYTLSNESFLKGSNTLKYLAVRGSYGIQGNIDKASSPDLIIQVGAKNQNSGLNESYFKYLPNPDLRWEKTTTINVGLDFSFFGREEAGFLDIISGQLDIYNKEGKDIIVTRSVSQVIGLEQVKINGGRVRNSGAELFMKIVPYQTKDFNISTNVVFSYNKNILVESNKDLNITNANKLSGNALIEGKPIGSFYSYEFVKLNEKWGYPMFNNTNNEARYMLYPDDTKLVYSGVNIPDYSGGFEISSRYKGIYLTVGLQYSVGGVSRLPNIYRTNYYAVFDPLTNASKMMKDRWRRPGDEAFTTIPVIYDDETFQQANSEIAQTASGIGKSPLEMYDRSTIRIAKTDNLRLRNIRASYLFSPKLCKRLGFESLSLNATAENLFILCDSRWGGRDPESGGSNIPLPKVFSFGINLSL